MEKEKWKNESFQEFINHCSLNDAHFQGQKYTWFGVREGELIKERLNRVLVNFEQIEEFTRMQVTNLPTIGSNHSLVVMNTEHKDIKNGRKFKFQVAWLTIEDCEKIVNDGWEKRLGGLKWNKWWEN